MSCRGVGLKTICIITSVVHKETSKLITDHKPLVTLINSNYHDTAPIRCQHLLLRLMKFNPVAEYVPRKDLIVVDAFSGSPMENSKPGDLEAEVAAYEDSVEDNGQVTKATIEHIKEKEKKKTMSSRVS